LTEDTELRDILRATAQNAALPTVMPEPMRRKVTLRRARTIGATLLTTVAIAVGGFHGIRALTFDEAAPTQTARQPGLAAPKVEDLTDRNIRDMTPSALPPEVPYLIDLTTRDMTPLPDSIVGSLAKPGRYDASRFAASPDGSSLAFVGEGDDGSQQIFIAGIDGTGVRQVTHDPKGAMSPAWSPDGTRVAYVGYGSGEVENLFVLDVATGETTQITTDTTHGLFEPQFTPDGSSLVHTDASALTSDPESRGCCGSNAVIRTVPVAGGSSTTLVGPGEGPRGLDYWAEASMSPDGSLVTFVGSGAFIETLPEGSSRHCDRCRFLVDVDGTDARIISGWTATPSGAWSPDGTRIVLARDPEPPFPIMVVDVVTGEASTVAEGPATAAIWLDDHTLLVDV
jgi:dipeptidyl aminopeptidase/acylaminoacyl peptidase